MMLSPVETAALVTAIFAVPVAAGIWVLLRYIPTADTEQEVPVETTPPPVRTGPGRHRFGEVATPYIPGRYSQAEHPQASHVHVSGAFQSIPVPAARPTADPVPEHPEPCGFPGVTPCTCRTTPDEWFGVPKDATRQLTTP